MSTQITHKGKGQEHIVSGGNKTEWFTPCLSTTLARARTLQAAQCEDHARWINLLGPMGEKRTERLYNLLGSFQELEDPEREYILKSVLPDMSIAPWLSFDFHLHETPFTIPHIQSI